MDRIHLHMYRMRRLASNEHALRTIPERWSRELFLGTTGP